MLTFLVGVKAHGPMCDIREWWPKYGKICVASFKDAPLAYKFSYPRSIIVVRQVHMKS